VGDLVELVVVSFDPAAGHAAMTRIASAILRGSHRRAREQLAAVVDQQHRVRPLTRSRPPTRRGFSPQKTRQATRAAAP
jgi:hypothetical protein